MGLVHLSIPNIPTESYIGPYAVNGVSMAMILLAITGDAVHNGIAVPG
jgi:hypothetical protein